MINLDFAWTITILASVIRFLMCSWIFYTIKDIAPKAEASFGAMSILYICFKFNQSRLQPVRAKV